MRVVNAARHVDARVTFGADKEGRNFLLVVFKATYTIPANDKLPRPCVPPQPVALSDHYAGEPGLSPILYENDLAPAKAACDVVFRAQAHSPQGPLGTGGQPCRSLSVVARVGGMAKALRVLGDRTWEKDLMIVRASRPKPFLSMPLHYGHAFGGWQGGVQGAGQGQGQEQGQKQEQPAAPQPTDVFDANPFGRGYAAHGDIHGKALHNIEFPGREVNSPLRGIPAALSPVPRTDPTRRRFAGTYDQQWKEEQAPFLPKDFDERFFQCVPEDQRIPFPLGGEEVTLINMMPGRPEVRFRLPRLDTVPVRVLHRDYRVSQPVPHVDTLYFEPDEGRFSVVWRARLPLGQRPAHELRTVVVGEVCRQWWEGVLNGGSGCQGCGAAKAGQKTCDPAARAEGIGGAALAEGTGETGGAGPAAMSGADAASHIASGHGPEPHLCPEWPDRPDQPAKDPHWPLPEIRIVLDAPDPKGGEEQAAPDAAPQPDATPRADTSQQPQATPQPGTPNPDTPNPGSSGGAS